MRRKKKRADFKQTRVILSKHRRFIEHGESDAEKSGKSAVSPGWRTKQQEGGGKIHFTIGTLAQKHVEKETLRDKTGGTITGKSQATKSVIKKKEKKNWC